MKLVKQARLVFGIGGKSPKLYEVEMAEVGADRFVVNFRYGKQGEPLKAGTKTTFPVNSAEAERVYAQLVSSKTEAGYVDEGAAGRAPAAAAPASSQTSTIQTLQEAVIAPRAPAPTWTADIDARTAAILACLEGKTVQRPGSRKLWRLDRAIWRAGELRLRAAEPQLLNLLPKTPTEPLRTYSVVWALGRCGSGLSVDVIRQRAVLDQKQPDYVRHMGLEALRALADEKAQKELIAGQVRELSGALRQAYELGQASALSAALTRGLQNNKRERAAMLGDVLRLYLIDDAITRPVVLAFLKDHPIAGQGDTFKTVRRLFKAAEFRCDGQVFGLIAYLIEKQAVRLPSRWGDRKANPLRKSTRAYFVRRAWRLLRRLNEDGDTKRFVQMAVGSLLPLTDADGGQATSVTLPARFRWDWVTDTTGRGRNTRRTRQRVQTRAARRVEVPTFGRFWAVNFLLRGRSAHLKPDRGCLRWVSTSAGGYKPEAGRIEWASQAWDQMPQGLLHVLSESRCELVHQFAARALGDQTAFVGKLRIADLVMLLRAPYAITADLGIALARPRYNAINPDLTLVSAALQSKSVGARKTAQEWIEAQRTIFTQNAAFVIDALFSPTVEVRRFFQGVLVTAPPMPNVVQALLDHCVQQLFQSQNVDANNVAADVLLNVLRGHLYLLGFDRASVLLDHNLPAVRDLALALIEDMIRHQPHRLTPDLLRALLTSSAEQVRSVGARILQQNPSALTDDLLRGLADSVHGDSRAVALRFILQQPTLEARAAWLIPLAFSQHADNRRACLQLLPLPLPLLQPLIESAIQHVCQHAPTSAPPDIAPLGPLENDLVALLHSLAGNIAQLPVERTILRLVRAAHPLLHGLAAAILPHLSSPGADLPTLVELANHAQATVRAQAQRLIQGAVQLLRSDLSFSIRLLDADWDDTRAVAAHIFQHQIGPQYLTPDIIIAICDSPRPETQHIGRTLLTNRFEDSDGPAYMLKLSEHPSADLQGLVTNLLDRFAAGFPDRIATLKPFFLSVLSRVNKNTVNKKRVFAFLRAQSTQNPSTAAVIADILNQLAPTSAVETRTACVEILLNIRRQFPTLQNPLTIHPPETRHAG